MECKNYNWIHFYCIIMFYTGIWLLKLYYHVNVVDILTFWRRSMRHVKISCINIELKIDLNALNRAKFLWSRNFEGYIGATQNNTFFKVTLLLKANLWSKIRIQFNVNQGLFCMFQGFKKVTIFINSIYEPTRKLRLVERPSLEFIKKFVVFF